MSFAHQTLYELSQLTPGTPECSDKLNTFLSRDVPAHINARVATEVTTEVDRQLKEKGREEEEEEDESTPRWIRRVAGVRGHTFQSGRRSKAFPTVCGVWISFVADLLLLLILPSALSILFFLNVLDHILLSLLIIAGLVFLGFWRRSHRRSELEGEIDVLEELRRQGIFHQRLRLLWRARGLREIFPGLATLVVGLFASRAYGLVPDNWKDAFQKVVDDAADAAGSSFSPSLPLKGSSKAK
ncbi:hypothetical protein L202_05064 [Cryptococcus amylolentus CBS 6039]|uniref:Uncharacterized protein n=1 Tax=Cryptococcus amylolentus CBS 6039 TaxID=1295533 RepID=A0A1E3HNS1_9TREE|nr:hypothetical protein L202_05064 [Cryptococcus amylolentus CBS 6039]ODN77972.1 hypothetical protein L202_05064 [Cryptococcus amylolentus CBS 6039]